jgi:hypothetical protein
VTNVQQIEAAVCQNDFFAACAPSRNLIAQLVAAQNFSCEAWLHAWSGQLLWIALINSCWVTVAVPRFITTIPPA